MCDSLWFNDRVNVDNMVQLAALVNQALKEDKEQSVHLVVTEKLEHRLVTKIIVWFYKIIIITGTCWTSRTYWSCWYKRTKSK